MDGTQNPTNSIKISTMHARWIGHLYSLVLELSLAAGKCSWAPLRPLQKAAVPHGTCHFWLLSSGKGCASARSQAESPGPGLASPWGTVAARGRRALSMANCVPGQLHVLPFQPPISPCLFYKQAFQENSALQGVVPSDMLSELCYPG